MIISSKKRAGMSLVEVVISSAIVLLISMAFISINLLYLKTSDTSIKTVKATYLIEEGVEAVNFLKDKDWAGLGVVGVNYYLVWIGTTWQATTTKSYIDQVFERKYSFENVNRDSNMNITLVGGTVDLNTRKLTVQVSWSDISGTTTKSMSSYLMKP